MILFILLLIFLPLPTLAYIDPGNGSYIAQVVIAFLLSFIVIFKNFWRSLYSKIKKIKK
jgi:hypothetical protein